MTRILPIIMLTIGLVLLSSSFATAATTETHAMPLAQWCVLDDQPTDTASPLDRPELMLGRCWKELALGMVVPGCKVHGQIPHACDIEPKQPQAHWAIIEPLIDRIGIEPFPVLPPPRV
ncbi:hypothetical protein [Pelagibacterium luteolum]|uniref:Secreted protein n=1 Tax=Pelagibacterium luteolum TaxID=440168 RepID=A0A1G7Y5L4_9HYPH|nr:hypothetical protein [Pelagibacterium luteolum]SDG91546.1 hypothetical protein SAMN04487974_11258 [Pelagibacterium luteolum]